MKKKKLKNKHLSLLTRHIKCLELAPSPPVALSLCNVYVFGNMHLLTHLGKAYLRLTIFFLIINLHDTLRHTVRLIWPSERCGQLVCRTKLSQLSESFRLDTFS